jgi:hypothetical protein
MADYEKDYRTKYGKTVKGESRQDAKERQKKFYTNQREEAEAKGDQATEDNIYEKHLGSKGRMENEFDDYATAKKEGRTTPDVTTQGRLSNWSQTGPGLLVDSIAGTLGAGGVTALGVGAARAGGRALGKAGLKAAKGAGRLVGKAKNAARDATQKNASSAPKPSAGPAPKSSSSVKTTVSRTGKGSRVLTGDKNANKRLNPQGGGFDTKEGEAEQSRFKPREGDKERSKPGLGDKIRAKAQKKFGGKSRPVGESQKGKSLGKKQDEAKPESKPSPQAKPSPKPKPSPNAEVSPKAGATPKSDSAPKPKATPYPTGEPYDTAKKKVFEKWQKKNPGVKPNPRQIAALRQKSGQYAQAMANNAADEHAASAGKAAPKPQEAPQVEPPKGKPAPKPKPAAEAAPKPVAKPPKKARKITAIDAKRTVKIGDDRKGAQGLVAAAEKKSGKPVSSDKGTLKGWLKQQGTVQNKKYAGAKTSVQKPPRGKPPKRGKGGGPKSPPKDDKAKADAEYKKALADWRAAGGLATGKPAPKHPFHSKN